MKAEKKGQLIGSVIGLLFGCIIAYLLWGFSAPGGIVILFGFGIGGIIGYNLGKKGGNMRRLILLIFSCIVLLVFISSCATAPPGSPPPGKVWHKVEGKWVLVPPPPKDGPYIWRNGKWVLSSAPPLPGKRWVPGHRGPRGHWIPGHWK